MPGEICNLLVESTAAQTVWMQKGVWTQATTYTEYLAGALHVGMLCD